MGYLLDAHSRGENARRMSLIPSASARCTTSALFQPGSAAERHGSAIGMCFVGR
ncbi:hypothetical protein UY3_00743 [Chelonia mydas]|uniref:Uncharacterized protein n=1 Tax=Chelonia mydas TaxID=8469 RepID=M7BW02_CHEMY|nr:hypothetical protein UY3_00743 [Chelonia mydas]